MPAPELFADPPPRATLQFAVGAGHKLQVQTFGRAEGLTALVLHGGPGSGVSPLLRRVFDPAHWRIVCPDQRGAGGSQPRGETAHNHTAALIDDLCLLRRHLGIERWVVVGGSWGATLALAYAAADPAGVEALLLRAVFLARPADVDAFFGTLSLDALDRALNAADRTTREAAAGRWWQHEQRLLGQTTAAALEGEALAVQVDRLRIQAHYLRHGCWLQAPTLLERCARVPRVPTLLLHAPDDRICPPDGATQVQRHLPGATLQWVAGAGHNAGHPAMVAATLQALARYAAQRNFDRPACA